MAIFHLNVSYVSRSTGRSSVQAAAYISGEKLHEDRRDIIADYTNRTADVAFSKTYAPEDAPAKFHTLSVWNDIENFEDRYARVRFPNGEIARDAYMNSAQTAMTTVVALPKELSLDAQIELVESFAKERFLSRRLVVSVALHKDEGNPHAHFMISRRSVTEKGEWSWLKDRDLSLKTSLLETRRMWAEMTNATLEREGFSTRITEKSFADLGVSFLPSYKKGWQACDYEQRGLYSRIVADNKNIATENRERLLENPKIILEAITATKSTFTQKELVRAIEKRIGNVDEDTFKAVFEKALNASINLGQGLDGRIHYTTEAQKTREAAALTQTESLLSARNHAGVSQESLQKKIAAFEAREGYKLSTQQISAIATAVNENAMSVIVGRAGAGKTSSLNVAADLYRDQGYRVVGMALSAVATENLKNETGAEAFTISSWQHNWNELTKAEEKFLDFNSIVSEGVLKQFSWYKTMNKLQHKRFAQKTVVFVDEASMIGTRAWTDILQEVTRSGAKLVVVGDDHQLKAIDAGDVFTYMVDRAKAAGNLQFLDEIHRQKHPHMRAASGALATLNIREGVRAYEDVTHGFQADQYLDEAAAMYVQKHALYENPKDCSVHILAFTKKEIAELNQRVQAQLLEKGTLGNLVYKRDQDAFYQGDRVMFLKNTRELVIESEQSGRFSGVLQQPRKPLTIKNGHVGVVESHFEKGGESYLRVTMAGTFKDQNKYVDIPLKQYQDFQHAYAMTTHKSQGATLDHTIVCASKLMNASLLYVALTRHRESTSIVYNTKEFTSYTALLNKLSRFEHKSMVQDHTILPHNRVHWQRVFDLKQLNADLSITHQQMRDEQALQRSQRKTHGSHPHHYEKVPHEKLYSAVGLSSFLELRQKRVALCGDILKNWEDSKKFVLQAGMTRETIEIYAGVRNPPRSFAAERAQIQKDLYLEMASVVRKLYPEYKRISDMIDLSKPYKTIPLIGHDLTKAADTLQDYEAARLERFSLARTLLEDHRSYLKLDFIGRLQKVVAYEETRYEREKMEEQARFKRQGSYIRSYAHSRSNSHAGSKEYDKSSLQNSGPQDISVKTDYGKKLDDAPRFGRASAINNTAKFSHTPFSHTSAEITTLLSNNIETLALSLLGEPQSRTSTQWRYGNKGSISVHVLGEKRGLYSNFESSTFGGALQMIAEHKNLSNREAFKYGVEFLKEYGLIVAPHQKSSLNINKKSIGETLMKMETNIPSAAMKNTAHNTAPNEQWTRVPFVPENAPESLINPKLNTPALAYMLKRYKEVSRYPYRTETGAIAGYVVRLESHDGSNKITPTLTLAQHNKTKALAWQWKGFGDERSLYNLDQLQKHPDRPVLVVEGEKTATAAEKILGDSHNIVTWSGGAGAFKKTDFTPLKGKDVVLWPDHDRAGIKAMEHIAAQLADERNPNRAASLRILDYRKDPLSRLPHKYDVADQIPKVCGITQPHKEFIRDHVQDAVPFKDYETIYLKSQRTLTVETHLENTLSRQEINKVFDKHDVPERFQLGGKHQDIYQKALKALTHHYYKDLVAMGKMANLSHDVFLLERSPQNKNEIVIAENYKDTAALKALIHLNIETDYHRFQNNHLSDERRMELFSKTADKLMGYFYDKESHHSHQTHSFQNLSRKGIYAVMKQVEKAEEKAHTQTMTLREILPDISFEAAKSYIDLQEAVKQHHHLFKAHDPAKLLVQFKENLPTKDVPHDDANQANTKVNWALEDFRDASKETLEIQHHVMDKTLQIESSGSLEVLKSAFRDLGGVLKSHFLDLQIEKDRSAAAQLAAEKEQAQRREMQRQREMEMQRKQEMETQRAQERDDQFTR